MIAGLGPYPVMKDSGVPRLGEVPSDWNVQRIKRLFREKDERSGDGHGLLLSLTRARGLLPQAEASNRLASAPDLSKYKVCRPGELVMNRMQAWSGMFAVSEYEGLVSPDYSVFAATERFELRFFEQLFKTPLVVDQFAQASKGVGSGFNRLYTPEFGAIPVAFPPLPEQAAIVRFLDHADRRIRRYIRAKQKLIKLLEEQKQAIIHRAVTHGLDPNVHLKPSGVEWLGDVPEHWKVMRVKQVTQVLRGKFTHRPRNDPSLYDGQYPFIQTGEVARAGKSIASFRQTLNERGLTVSKLFPAGTLLMTIAANIGDVAILDFEACFPDSVVGFVPSARVERDFLYYLFVAMKPELLREAPVNTQGNLNVDRIGARAIALPPEIEQQAIVRWIEASCASLTGAVEKAGGEVSLLREYRTRLIADVVTGKLDVREAAARLPEEAEELEPLDEAEALGEVEGESTADDLDAESEEAEA
ncbi:MAG: restriction endonuclease subunit S [Accumulibacter sp.]|jgi:type I restriction enzyme S subunit